jgi:hypothetical protein
MNMAYDNTARMENQSNNQTSILKNSKVGRYVVFTTHVYIAIAIIEGK